jgi:hypothetical protein
MSTLTRRIPPRGERPGQAGALEVCCLLKRRAQTR